MSILQLYTRHTTVVYKAYYSCIQSILQLYTRHSTVVYNAYYSCIQGILQLYIGLMDETSLWKVISSLNGTKLTVKCPLLQ